MKVIRTLATGAVVTLLLAAWSVSANGWSLNPFASSTDTKTAKSTAAKPTPKPAKSQPSTAGKAPSGTKKFFSGVGDALTFKKAAPKTPTNSYTMASRTSAPKSKSSSWWPFQREEPKKKPTVTDFLSLERPE